MEKSLREIIKWSALNPGYVQDYCRYWFDRIQIGYVPSLNKLQIACFDEDGECRLCVWYQFGNRSGIWTYEVVPGFKYREPEDEE